MISDVINDKKRGEIKIKIVNYETNTNEKNKIQVQKTQSTQ